jgi:hypothetical protein
MKALTICQPYAHLIVQGRKTCENRTWPTNYRGPMLIHAGKNRSFLDDDGAGFDFGYSIRIDAMAFGAVVAIADLVACINVQSKLLPEWVAKMTEEQQQHVFGPWCWILANVKPIEPSEWRGAQGLFDIPADAIPALS